MTIIQRSIRDVTLLDIKGRIAVQDGASQFGSHLRRVLHQGRVNMVLDFGAVPYIDSIALGELARAFATASQMGGRLKLVHVEGRVRHLLGVAHLLTTFELFDDEAGALASFAAA
jgi:anti-sigma B factor antagonist